jgi:L-aminopeptidase/D-esterase-like protein
MLTPDEQVINRASSNQMRRDYPGAFEYMNATGKLPPTGGGAPVLVQPVVHVYIDGTEMDGRMVRVARDEIGNAVREAARLRPRA